MLRPADAPVDSWSSVLASRSTEVRPWVILPLEPQRSDRHRATSYAELHRGARRVARALRGAGAERGDRVVVIADNSVESALLLMGGLLSGLTVTPVPPRGLSVRGAGFEQALRTLCRHCDARLLVGRDGALPHAPPVSALGFEQLITHGDDAPLAPPAGDDLALLQYTSGTTSAGRGVELTHRSVLGNVAAIGEAIGATANDVGVAWLPFFHDMGLIGCLLFATYWGMPLVLLSPRAFQMRPESWLWAISRFGGTCSVAPNSAYQLCASKLPQRKLQGLDLSSWRAALTGAELIYPETLDAFASRFAQQGFRREALFPVYGLAENTLAATFPVFGCGPKVDWVQREPLETRGLARPVSPDAAAPKRGVVCVGTPLPGQRLRVVAGDGQPVAPRTLGRIELRGDFAMRGYHNVPAHETTGFTADGWLRTGDRGYVADGELYVVGRDKHVIKRAGRSFDGEDIQTLLQNLAGIRGGAIAAFGLADPNSGTEQLVVAVETQLIDAAERRALRRAIAQRMQHALAAQPDVIALWKPGTIPRTTSGKTRHDHAREILRAQQDAERL